MLAKPSACSDYVQPVTVRHVYESKFNFQKCRINISCIVTKLAILCDFVSKMVYAVVFTHSFTQVLNFSKKFVFY